MCEPFGRAGITVCGALALAIPHEHGKTEF